MLQDSAHVRKDELVGSETRLPDARSGLEPCAIPLAVCRLVSAVSWVVICTCCSTSSELTSAYCLTSLPRHWLPCSTS